VIGDEQEKEGLLSRQPSLIVVYYLDDVGERYFDYLAVGAFHFDAGLGKRLRGLHAADDAAHAVAVVCENLYVVFAVKRL
jgi:hypothetical protein